MIEITDSAATRIKELITGEKEQTRGLRISVKAGGCADFSYSYTMEEKIKPDDKTYQHSGAFVIIDPVSDQFLQGCTLDFVLELGASYFQINNPAATGKCGCGNSFSV